MYYLAEPLESSTVMQVNQQGPAANSVVLGYMWLMIESGDGEYTTLDGRKWLKLYEYVF